MNLESFKDKLALIAFGITRQEAWKKGICIDYKQPALPKCHTKAGRYVYTTSTQSARSASIPGVATWNPTKCNSCSKHHTIDIALSYL
jgi:hypothetical protein